MSEKKTGFALNPENINRKGRPKKGQTLTELLSELGDANVEKRDRTYKEVLCSKLWDLAIGGDLGAIKYIYDRIDGKPVETVDMHTVDESMIDVLNRVHEEHEQERLTIVK